MSQRHSIRVRLSLACVVLGLLVLALGLLSVWWLGDVDAASAELRDRWLQSSRLLGDLNNYTSDYRAAEASHLLHATPADLVAGDAELATLTSQIDTAWVGYLALPHDAQEAALRDSFAQRWARYRLLAQEVVARSHRGAKTAGDALYLHESRVAYAAASDTLGALTELTADRMRAASNLAARTYRHARVLIFLAIGLAGSIVLMVTAHITRTISAPILSLAKSMRALAGNQTGIEIGDVQRNDEVGEMARAVVVFRSNAIALAQSQRGLEQQASMLAEKLEHEQHLANLQRNFVSMASHEFRTPLTVIDGQAQRLIKAGERSPTGDVAERAAKIRTAVRRMTNLLESMIDAARLLEADQGLYFHIVEFKPEALLREVCQMHREITQEAWIVERIGPLPATVEGDPKLLSQAVSNLLANALKYSAGAEPVELAASFEGDSLLVSVCDYGIGIPSADLPHIFERYFRGSNVRGIVGTGIGLYLVKTVAQLHGGDITVDSREGTGSVFTLRTPIRHLAAAAAASAPRQSVIRSPVATVKQPQGGGAWGADWVGACRICPCTAALTPAPARANAANSAATKAESAGRAERLT